MFIVRGQLLIAQDDPSTNVFVLEAGNLLLFRTNAEGKEIALDCIGPGDACGIEEVVSRRLYSLSGRATAAGAVWRIPARDLLSLMSKYPSLAKAVVGYLAERLCAEAERVELLTLERLSDRVRAILWHLASRSGATALPVDLPITQSHVAALAGASRQRVNRILVSLHEMGVADSRGRYIRILDPFALQRNEGLSHG
jgi:CRP-like cAMP-binding protein